jgi:TRAP-type C4-dicarboxylate transport system permease small subunit
MTKMKADKMAREKKNSEELLVVSVSRHYTKACLILAIVGMAAIGVMSFSTSMDVLKRWITGWPFEGVMQLNECLMVVMVFLGLGFAQVHRRHIRIAFIISRMSPKRIVIADIISCILATLCLGIMMWNTLEEGLWSCSTLEYRFGNVRMPIYWARMLIPVGLFGIIGQLLIDIWTNIMRLRGRLPLEISDVRKIYENE